MPQAPKIQKSISKIAQKVKNSPSNEVASQNPGDVAGIKRKDELQKMFEDVQNKDRAINSAEIVQNNKTKQERFRLLQNLFQLMEDNGVDPTDLESIQRFLSRLQYQDPDLLALFEYAFNGLLGEEQGPAGPVGPQTDLSVGTASAGPKGIMDRFSNLTQATMMPRNAAPSPAPAPVAPTAPVAPENPVVPPQQ